MGAQGSDHTFAGSIPHLYETHLVPMLFAPYAADLVDRVAARPVRRLLELAAGTGAVTRALAARLPDDVTIVATDLNEAMLDEARARGTARPVTWQRADALSLPFPDHAFDHVICQFGAMFFPDKVKGFAEARRVLAPGGRFVFNVWDRLGANEVTACAMEVLASFFPDDPPSFMERTPHGYHEAALIARHLREAGFAKAPLIEAVEKRSRAISAKMAALALCQGTPLRHELEARAADRLDELTEKVAVALAARFGGADGAQTSGQASAPAIDGKMRAYVVTVEV